MVKNVAITIGLLIVISVVHASPLSPPIPQNVLAERILQDQRMDQVVHMGRELLTSGMNAGSGYQEVWIRDLNTFIVPLLEKTPAPAVRESLLIFFHFQGEDGNIIDGYVPKNKGNVGYKYRFTPTQPQLKAHKNTVETDQESSLVQAVCRYVRKTQDTAFLDEVVRGIPVRRRLEIALEYPLTHRYAEDYGLIWGATTADWGDVQPEHRWGVEFDANSHRAIDIYDNALFLVAIGEYLDLIDDGDVVRKRKWETRQTQLHQAIRKHLWDGDAQKFVPHIYLDGSPFPKTFNEAQVYYHGGTAVAIEAGLLTPPEVLISYGQMLANMRLSGAATLGLTLYPAYPEGTFQNKAMKPYAYQNGGDWTWFGARMVRQLVRYGYTAEAYRELIPMLERVLEHGGFYEWWSLDNQPKGSGHFRGSAGVLIEAIQDLRRWAERVPLTSHFGLDAMAVEERRQPNIIIVLADDLGYGDVGCFGSERFHTPHIDALAADGIRFTDFHSNGVVCSPTRAALLTGRYQQRTGITGVVTAANHRHTGLDLQEKTFAEVAKAAGYRTALFGKWHLGYQPDYNPVHQGFDEFIGYVSGNVDYHAHLDQTGREDWWKQDTLKPETGYTTDLVTKHGVGFIERNKDKPFLLYLAHEAPHYPYQGRKDPPRYTRGKGRTKDPVTLEVYKEMIEVMDEGVGRIRQTLMDTGLSDNTLIFFFSDNGPAGLGSAGPLRGKKGQIWEGGHRVPAVACWPGTIQPGRVSHATLMGADLWPTIAEISGASVPEDIQIDGVSLLSHLKSAHALASRPLFWGSKKSLAIRVGNYKLVTTTSFVDFALYDLRHDLGETHNIAEENPELVQQLLKQLKEWQEDVHEGVKKRT